MNTKTLPRYTILQAACEFFFYRTYCLVFESEICEVFMEGKFVRVGSSNCDLFITCFESRSADELQRGLVNSASTSTVDCEPRRRRPPPERFRLPWSRGGRLLHRQGVLKEIYPSVFWFKSSRYPDCSRVDAIFSESRKASRLCKYRASRWLLCRFDIASWNGQVVAFVLERGLHFC